MRQHAIIIMAMLIFVSCQERKTEYFRELVDQGVDLANTGKFTEAIQAYSKAISINPKVQLAYYNRGISFIGVHDYLNAFNDFNRVIRLQTRNGYIFKTNPVFDKSDESEGQVEYKDALYQRAIAMIEIDSFHQSFSDLEYLVNENYEQKTDCIINQAIILGKLGNKSKACEYFEKAKTTAINREELISSNEILQNYCQTIPN